MYTVCVLNVVSDLRTKVNFYRDSQKCLYLGMNVPYLA